MSGISLLTRGFVSKIQRSVNQSALVASQAQAVLAQAINLDTYNEETQALGIHQSDVILRTAIIAVNPAKLRFLVMVMLVPYVSAIANGSVVRAPAAPRRR